MAHVLFNKLKNTARYLGQYLDHLDPYVDTSQAFFLGGLAEKYDFNQKDRGELLNSLANGAIPGVGQVQNAWKTGPDSRGRCPQRGIDATVSFDKALSVALVACSEHRDELLEAARKSLEEGFTELEERCALARGGSTGGPVPGLWACFAVPEFTSRNGDVQIHFHVIVFTAIECEDGVVRALDNRPLFQHAKWAGAMITAELAKRLDSIGFTVAPSPGEGLRIEGIPESLCNHWSSRRREVLDHMEAHGLSSPKQSDIAAIASRRTKESHETLSEVLSRHEREARELGFDLGKVAERCFNRQEHVRELASDEPEKSIQKITDRIEPDGPGVLLPDLERAIAAEAPRLRLGIREVISLAQAAVRKARLVAHHLERDLRHHRFEKAVRTLGERAGLAANVSSVERAALKHDLPAHAVLALKDLMGSGPALRVLDGSDAGERHRVLAAVRDIARRSGADTVAVALRKKDTDAIRDRLRMPAFTIAKAVQEWKTARSLLREPGAGGFTKIHTDPIQDKLAWAAGLRTRGEIRWRAWQRDRQPLDLSDGRHILIVEEAHELSSQRLGEALDEARRAGATVILSGDSTRSSCLDRLAADRLRASLENYASELEARAPALELVRAADLKRLREERDLGRSR